MQEERLSEQESLRIIESMINKAKNQFSENGHLYLLWGWVIFFCSIGQFILLHILHFSWGSLIWILTWATVVYQYIYIKRKLKQRKVKTYTDEILGMVWLAFVFSVFLWAVVLGNIFENTGRDFFGFVNPVFLLLYGMPTFISGFALKFKPLWLGAIGCWVLSIVAALLPVDYQVLMLAVAMVIAWIVPGYLLRAKYKNNVSNV